MSPFFKRLRDIAEDISECDPDEIKSINELLKEMESPYMIVFVGEKIKLNQT